MTPDRTDIAGVVIADATLPGFPLTYVSPGFETLTGYRSSEVLGGSCAVLQGPETDPRVVADLSAALAAGREAYAVVRNYRADGTPFWNELALAPQRDESGAVVHYLGVQKDVSARMEADARIHRLAYYDALTGLANRTLLHRELEFALREAHGTDTELALLFIDLDDFKRVNDTHGHHVGDALLVAVASRLRSVIRGSDLLARLGGDEFCVLVRDVEDAGAIGTDLAARVVTGMREPFELDGMVPLEVRATVGVSAYPRDADAVDLLLRHADAAMYVAKAGGKDGFHLHSPRAASLVHAGEEFDPRAHVGELAEILDTGAVTALFQPIVELTSGDVVAFEALARGPQGTALARPDRLFAVAEAAGRTTELDWLCRATAVRAALEARLGRAKSLFLNCEPSAIGTPCPEVHAEVWQRGMRELNLVLEITERAVTDRPAELAGVVDDHRAAGRGIALDDIGADVRSLALLPLLEPDVIKLDLRLVQNRPSLDQAAIVSAVAAEHERTGAAILAEGVETDEHLAAARALGATLGQGWKWGRPAPLPANVGGGRAHLPVMRRTTGGRTPFEVVATQRPVSEATKALLLPMSHHLENRALRIGEGAVILSAFQHARHFTPKTVRRYESLVRGASLVGAFGVGLPPEPIPGIRGAHIDADDPLAGEWSVVVIGPHFAGALVAQDLGDTGPQSARRFLFAAVYDRALVIDAARTLLKRITPVSSPGRRDRLTGPRRSGYLIAR